MSSQWFYDVDGRIGGPITPIQLQLMVNSGMLQPHHKIRKEYAEQWILAGSVRGLFSETVTETVQVAQAVPAAPVEVPLAAEGVPVPLEEDNPFAPLASVTTESGGSAFDFFSEPAAAPPPPVPQPVSRPAKSAKPAPPRTRTTGPASPFDEPPSEEPVPNSPDTGAMPAGSKPQSPGNNVREKAERPFIFAPPAVTEAGSRQDLDANVAPALHQAAATPESPALRPVDPIPATPVPPSMPEVSGKAVELLPDDTVRLIDGKTSFRLHRTWLLAVTKLADGSVKTVYLRLQRLDGATLEHRYESGRSRKGPFAVLSFQAGELTIALLLHGNDKPYRAFIEKVLAQSNLSKVPPPKG